MTRHLAWWTVLLVGGTALAMLLASLMFVPIERWESYVPIAAIVGALGLILAGVAVESAGERLVRPMRRLVRSIEQDAIGDQSLHELVRQAPAEMAPLLYGLHVTHARLRRILSELEQDRAEMSALFEHMADCVLVLDADERIVLSNPAAARVLNGPIVGRSLAEVTRDAELVDLARHVTDANAQARLIEFFGPENGERRWIQAVATVLPEQRRLLVLQDISELRRAEVARRDFVANVSHELRTPVAALKALVETLEQGAIDDPVEGPAFLHRMHVEVDGLAQLVTELLDLARAEAGRLELHLAPCRADELVREVAARAEATARQAELRLDVCAGADKDELWVCADSRRMGQVLSNLLSNAAKFTPAGGHIQAGARRHGNRIELWVTDTGVGIEPEHLARVFERFYKTDPSRAAGTGTGLGLAIAKHLVLAHGGQIWAESAGFGRGATFRVSLPVLADDAS
ncbi:MAG: PAS domain-containing protein [Chloroflexi bacterium]|nr:PAS domain-containing protein [Chloroflexota bacterium]